MEKLTKLIKGISTSVELDKILGKIHEDVDAKGAPDNNTGIIVKWV